MKQARLGRLDVARIGFGAMGMSAYYTGDLEKIRHLDSTPRARSCPSCANSGLAS
jgi:hypothetical protein